jgi:hypothetical protein
MAKDFKMKEALLQMCLETVCNVVAIVREVSHVAAADKLVLPLMVANLHASHVQ